MYVQNNPLNYVDPTGRHEIGGDDDEVTVNLAQYKNRYEVNKLVTDLKTARSGGRDSANYWVIRSNWGKKFKNESIIPKDSTNNQYKYLFELSTLTRSNSSENSVDNAKWGTAQLLTYLDKHITPKEHKYVTVQITTFIPYKRIGGIGLGDNRDLWEKGTHRTQHSVVVDFETGKIVSESKDASGSEIDVPYIYNNLSDPPSTDGLRAESILQDGVLSVKMSGEVASLDLKKIPGLNISYNFKVMLDANGIDKVPTLVGKHDGFPAYEVLVIPQGGVAYGYGYDPRESGDNIATTDNILSLLGSMEWEVNQKMICLNI